MRIAPFAPDAAALLVETDAPEAVEAGVVQWRLGSEIVEANDLGMDGDLQAGDGLFTAIGPFDSAAFEQARQGWQDRIAARPDTRGMSFDGRSPQRIFEVHPDSLIASDTTVEIAGIGAVTAHAVFPAISVADAEGDTVDSGLPPTSEANRALLITDPSIVNHPEYAGHWQLSPDGECQRVGNPNAPWSFRGLLEGIANGHVDPDELGSDWIAQNATNRTVNGHTIPMAFQGVWDLVEGSGAYSNPVAWPKIHDDGNPSTFNDILDFQFAPLELIAIVNRIDLAAGGYDAEESATPELRFVFTFIDEETCTPAPGNVILEYAVPGDCGEIVEWANAWHELSDPDVTSDELVERLLELTQQITAAGVAAERPNGTNLKVLRTNEQVFRWPHYITTYPTNTGRMWDMQEWRIDPATHRFTNGLLAQTPGNHWELPAWSTAGQPQDIDPWIQANAPDIVDLTYTVPPTSGGAAMRSPFIGYGLTHAMNSFVFSSSDFPPSTWVMWRGVSWGSQNLAGFEEERQLFSLNTCSGCHFGETFEDGDGSATPFHGVHAGASTPGGQNEEPFRHIRPDNNLDNPAHLSRFITGTNASCAPGQEFVAPLGSMTACSSPSCCPIGDPVFGYGTRQVHYNELARRGSFLEDLVVHGCEALEAHQQNPVVLSAH